MKALLGSIIISFFVSVVMMIMLAMWLNYSFLWLKSPFNCGTRKWFRLDTEDAESYIFLALWLVN